MRQDGDLLRTGVAAEGFDIVYVVVNPALQLGRV
jgi:hypothetical protein